MDHVSDAVKPELLEMLGIDPQDFANWTSACKGEYRFPDPALGMPENVIHCQMRGQHERHKAMFHGFPYEWE